MNLFRTRKIKCKASDQNDGPTETEVITNELLTQEELGGLLLKWQSALRLLDWDISIGYGHHTEFDNSLASINFDEFHAVARIKLCEPAAAAYKADLITYDPEFLIVHELLHIRLLAIEDRNCKTVEEERVINIIASALLDVDRGIDIEFDKIAEAKVGRGRRYGLAKTRH